MSQVATYKGRKYKLVWQGQTKYGQKAKLAFFDGSKEFWADLSAVEISTGSHSHNSRRGRIPEHKRCKECGMYNPYGDPCGEPCN